MSAIVATEEQNELREAVRSLLEQSKGPRPFLAETPSDQWYDRELLNALNQELGVADLIVPEDLGGSGGTVADAAVVFEELGAHLAPVPFFSTAALAIPALLATGGETAQTLLARIGGGEAIVTVADGRLGLAEDHSVDAVSSAAGEWTLTGRSGVVIEGAAADNILVVAQTQSGPTLFSVETSNSGVSTQPLQSVDLTRGFAEVSFHNVPAELLGVEGEAVSVIETARDFGAVFLAAEQVGGAQKVLDTSVEYAKTRVQFDQKIGSFQQISSTLVDLLLEVEMSRSALIRAIDAAQSYVEDPDEETRRALSMEASMAKAMCSEAYTKIADEGLHVLGGIGFTWEHDAHLYFRRAMSTRQLLGGPDAHWERMAQAAGL
jgi:alkylation response protein AidB-like acyl-CoA dehydrogenase